MAVEKMKLLSIVGEEKNLDKFISEYLLDSGIQPEDVLKVYEKGWKLSYFDYENKTKDIVKRCENLMSDLELNYSKAFTKVKLECSIESIQEELNNIENSLKNSQETIIKSNEEIKKLEYMGKSIDKLENLDMDISKIYNSKYMKFRYGKINKENFEQVKKESENMEVIVSKVAEEDDAVWLIYFTTKEFEAKIDSYFNVMKFERIWIPEEIYGSPKVMMSNIKKAISQYKDTIEKQKIIKDETKKKCESTLLYMYRQLIVLQKVEQIKKFFAHDNNHNFYLIGWIPLSELNEILPRFSKEKDIQFKVKDQSEVPNTPPTHLKNNWIVRKFEKIVEMYGMPNYTETDPTTFVAITAFIMFGFMFGDVGQGLCIAIIGLILSKKKNSIGPILTAGGISAIIFGFLYGSIFGKEGIIPSLLISPMENITNMLIAGISFGAILILIAMIINIKNGIKNKDIKKIFFSENGLAGLIFYLTILLAVIYYFLKGKMIVSFGILASILVILLLIIMFKENLEKIIVKKKKEEKGSLVEKIFEIIEMLLSVASNTISFVRLSAFAINHVGLCMAVYILSNMASGAGNIAIAIIGNIVVIVLEGLIVAIQVLRLEYYELFSRFYQGDGRPYKPLKSEI